MPAPENRKQNRARARVRNNTGTTFFCGVLVILACYVFPWYGKACSDTRSASAVSTAVWVFLIVGGVIEEGERVLYAMLCMQQPGVHVCLHGSGCIA